MRRALPLLVAVLAFVVFAVLWIVTDRRAPQRVYARYSSANTSEEGLSLAHGYLSRQRKVAQLTRPLGRITIERTAVVFRIAGEFETLFDPEDLQKGQVGPPRPERRALLTEREDAFVRRGGRFVIAAREGLFDTVAAGEGVAQKVFPVWPAVRDLALDGDARAFTGLGPRMLPLFTAGNAVVVARERIGEGEVIVLSAPELLLNRNLARNLALLAGLAGDQRPVYFDEVLHGIVSDDGPLALMKEWNLGAFLLLLALTALVVFWRESRRVGPAEDDFRESRSDAIDLVRSLGALYDDVTTDAEALGLYYDALTRTVAHNSGLRGDALHRRVAELTGGLTPRWKPDPTDPKTPKLPRAVFERHLAAINAAFRTIESQGHGARPRAAASLRL